MAAMNLLKRLGGASTHRPEQLKTGLTKTAATLVETAFADVNSQGLLDYHTHVAGIGAGGTKNLINPKMQSRRHPLHHLKFKIYLSASGVENIGDADREFVLRLVDLARHIEGHGKYCLLAFDKNYNPDGTVNAEKTEFHVPNEYVFALRDEFPDLFVPVISVHPYRGDALAELQRWSTRGGRIVKWLPNAMGIDPSGARCDPYYAMMKELGLILISHGGEEKAVEAKEDQRFGNPLLLRRALEHGIKVIIAHCAGLGDNEDVESRSRSRLPNFKFFLRLMEDKRYHALLFGEISAMTQYNRAGSPLKTILERVDLHHRIVNGSDYPLPAINALVRTKALVSRGYIDGEERESLNEIYHYNPLLFDFVLKRHLKLPGTKRRLPASVFMTHPDLSVDSYPAPEEA
jgi:predicted TIM-barrel fold metal-dependent hydrolase